MAEHVPNVKQQTDLFRMRNHARVADTERRAQVNQTVDLAQAAEQQQQAETQRELLQNGQRWMHNSEQTMVRLVKQSAAFSRAIAHMAEAWGPKDQDPIEVANGIIADKVKEIDNDPGFDADAKRWSQARIKQGASTLSAQVKKRPKP